MCSKTLQLDRLEIVEYGNNHGRGNLLGIQPDMAPVDYASAESLYARADGYLGIAQQQGWLNEQTIVVFPEYNGINVFLRGQMWDLGSDGHAIVVRSGEAMQARQAFKIETVRAKPITVFGRTLTPVARVISVLGHRGTIRQTRIEGRGWGAVLVQPWAVIEMRDGVERVLPIKDITRSVLCQMGLVALVVPLVALVLIAAGRLGKRHRLSCNGGV